jgi:hypothetical protein
MMALHLYLDVYLVFHLASDFHLGINLDRRRDPRYKKDKTMVTKVDRPHLDATKAKRYQKELH